MKKASITKAKNNLSAPIDRVKGGSPVLIVDRGRPVVRLEPVSGGRPDDDSRLARLVREGIVRPARRGAPKDLFATNEGAVLEFDRGTTYQATVAWPVWRTVTANVSIEVPFIATPAFTVVTSGASLPLEYASLYLTPGVRVTVVPNAPVSLFGAVGAGYARYSESRLKADRSPNPDQRDTNAAAIEFGGGVDVRGARRLGFRVELRDVYTGSRNFSITAPRPHVNNVIGSGGLVIRF